MSTFGSGPFEGHPALTVETEWTGPREATIRPVGDVDVAGAPRFRQALIEAASTHPEVVVVDLSRVEFMDSTGLGVLVGANRRLAAEGARLMVRSPNLAVRRTMEITSLDRVFTVEP